ncbi:hypothetical protein LUZ62_059716 [Rhynchospora pubera]|uniref:PRLI-interacting factor A n=1 Tax=Rhynchospora pubera TaxID=906938 RepID=A0AAV8E5C4_9POAL|nr:hypothetical protein LUZ62_059716 [Rhynchospora pubera]
MDPSQIPNQLPFQNLRPRANWKKHKSNVTKKLSAMAMASTAPPPPDGSYSYYPPSLQVLQAQNHIKSRRFYKKKYPNPRFAPFAPRNTTSFIIRAKKSGGIASLVSPSPVTPAILPTPRFSPTREGLVDMAKEEWGVDGYGSMSGLIRLRSPKEGEDEEDGSSDSSESDVEEHVEVERRLDHDLSRFEMIYPVGPDENQDGEGAQAEARVARLEEENLTLRERLFLVETEVGEIRRRLEELEKRFQKGNGMDVDGSNGTGENLSGGDVDGRCTGEENGSWKVVNGGNVEEKNVNADDVGEGNAGENNRNLEDGNGDNEENLSPVKNIGTSVQY